MKKQKRRHAVAGWLILFAGTRILGAQSLSSTPGSIQDLAGEFPVPEAFTFEEQIQSGTQGNPASGNPFSYGHALQARSWLHYDGLPNLTLTSSMSYIYYFTVAGTSYYRHPEWRFTGLGNWKQALRGGSLYEQVRFELLDFRASNGSVQHLPRLRLRTGQNLHLSENDSKPYLGIYEEAIVQFPDSSYSRVKFQGSRFFAGYGFDFRAKANFLIGFKAEAEVSSSGSTVTFFYGPAFSIDYTFTRRPANVKHKRTTAFKDFLSAAAPA